MAVLSDWADHAAAIVAELDPIILSEHDAEGFELVDGLLSLEAEPLVADRAFDVEPVSSGATLAMLGPDVVQRRGRVEVAIRYDSRGRRHETRARIDADTTQIVDALESPDAREPAHGGNVVQLVTFTGDTTIFDGAAAIVRLAFDVLYTEET